MRLVRVLVVAGTALLLAAVAGEVLVRRLDLIDRMNRFPRELFQASAHPGLKYTMRPGLEVRVRDMIVKTNQLGMREREIGEGRSPGTWRILVVGDSVAFGEGLPVESAFPRLTEALLASRTGQPVEVLNAGVEGYNTEAELALLKLLAPRLDPDTAVVVFNLNDFDDVPEVDQRGILTRQSGPRSWLAEQSEFWRVLRPDSIDRLLTRARAVAGVAATPAPARDERGFEALDLYVSALRKRFWGAPSGERWQRLEAAFAGFAAEMRRSRYRLLFAIVPDGDQFRTGRVDLNPQNQVALLCQRHGIECLDLYPAFRDSPEWPLFSDIMHPNGSGHEIIARQLADHLFAAGYRPADPRSALSEP